MNGPIYPAMPINYSPRRNRAKMLEAMQRAYEERQTAVLQHKFRAAELTEKIDQMHEVPDALRTLILAQLEQMMPYEIDAPPTAEELKRQELEQLADQHASWYLEKAPGGLQQLWNFDHVLEDCLFVSIAVAPYQPARYAIKVLHRGSNNPDTLTDDTADAFINYLHYLGIFEAIAARVPCPECGTKPPGPCERCGGLKWVLH